MKKIIVSLAVILMFAAPASAAVSIICTPDGNEVTVSFTNTDQTTGNPVRAFALDIILDNPAAKIVTVTAAKTGESTAGAPGYGVFPASFAREIDPGNPNWDDPNYTPVALLSDLPSDTQPGMDSNGITVELGSLYVGDANKPVEGDLLTFVVDTAAACNVVMALNVSRGGVVMENGDTPTPSMPGCTIVACDCFGDADGSGKVNASDIIAIAGWIGSYGVGRPPAIPSSDTAHYVLCADATEDGQINASDIIKIAGWIGSYGTGRPPEVACPHSYP